MFLPLLQLQPHPFSLHWLCEQACISRGNPINWWIDRDLSGNKTQVFPCIFQQTLSNWSWSVLSLKIQNTTLPSSLVSNHWKWRIIKEGWRKKNVGGYSPNTQARQHPCTCTMLRSVITVRSRNVHVFRKLLLASNRERKDEHSGQIPGAEMGEPR